MRLLRDDRFHVLTGSGEIYGPPARLPVDEDAPLRPQKPYAVSKAACDLLGGQYADARGLHVIRTRSFNHAGPGQSDEYVAALELPAGAYNVCSGRTASVRDLVELARAAARVEIQQRDRPRPRPRARRARDPRGSAERLRASTGWEPTLPLAQTVVDALDGWRERLTT